MEKLALIKSALLRLGLRELDADIYLFLTRYGPTSVTKIASELSIERPTVYSAIERLKKIGLTPAIKKYHQQFVQVESPLKIAALIEYQKSSLSTIQDQIESILPELQTEHALKNHTSSFRVFEGKRQFLMVFEEVLKEATEEILYYGDAKTFINFEGMEYEKKWIKKRVNRKLPIKILVFKDEVTKSLEGKDKLQLRETKFIPPIQTFKSSFLLYGTKTLLWSPISERAIVIDDKILADMFRSTFQFMWAKAKN